MGNKYPRISLEEHYNLSQRIKRFRNFLITEMTGLFPKQHPVTRAENKALEAVEEMQCHLDTELFRDFGVLHRLGAVNLLDIYYDGDEELTPSRCAELQFQFGHHCRTPIQGKE